MLIMLIILAVSSVSLLYFVIYQYVYLIKRQNQYNKAVEEFKNVTNKISKFIHTDDNITKHYDKVHKYLELISIDYGLSIESSTKNYKSATRQLVEEFKNLVPDFIQEERDNKINQLIK